MSRDCDKTAFFGAIDHAQPSARIPLTIHLTARQLNRWNARNRYRISPDPLEQWSPRVQAKRSADYRTGSTFVLMEAGVSRAQKAVSSLLCAPLRAATACASGSSDAGHSMEKPPIDQAANGGGPRISIPLFFVADA